MRDARAEHFLQWVYAYVMLILGVLAIGTSVGQAGGRTLVDALLASPSGQWDPIPLQSSESCSIHDPGGRDPVSCSKLKDRTFIDMVLPPVSDQQPIARQLAGRAWLDLDLFGQCQLQPPLVKPSCT